MAYDRTPDERLTAIETLVMQIQRDLEQMHEAVLGQQRDLDALRSDLIRLRGDVDRIDLGPESRDPKLEKPPHY